MNTILHLPDAVYWHGFNLLPQCGPNKLGRLSEVFRSGYDAFSATKPNLFKAGLEEEFIQLFLKHRETINLETEWGKLNSLGIFFMTPADDNYPLLLKQIIPPPPLLYYRGAMQNPDELCIAVVGTRKITAYGRTVTPELVTPLIYSGATIVSGLAYGVDAAAHQLAIDVGKRTVAVLAGGIDENTLYPRNHVLMADRILENGGAIISEYPPGTPALKHHFLARNRIISGLAAATIIIECNLKSGSLITAKYALEQNRTLFAVPGPIYSDASLGPNNLIKMGARLITNANDVLDDLNLKHYDEQTETQSTFGDTPTETKLLTIITREPMLMNEIIKQSELEAADVISALTFLEMKGKIRNLGGQQYCLAR